MILCSAVILLVIIGALYLLMVEYLTVGSFVLSDLSFYLLKLVTEIIHFYFYLIYARSF